MENQININEIINHPVVYGLNRSVVVSKYAMTTDTETCTDEITQGVDIRGRCIAGTGHNNFLCGIIVQFDLTFTIKAWTEAERYHWFDIVTSQSTMHRISKMDFDKTFIKYTDKRIVAILEELKNKYLETKDKEDYLKLLYSCPTGLKLTAGITTNYLQLKTIYKQRHDHRLPEWRAFCDWLETLPHSEWITAQMTI